MWEAIQYVTSGLTLLAFFGAISAYIISRKSKQTENLIKSAKETDRAKLVSKTLEFYEVNTSNLTKQQQYDLAITQVQARARRFSTIAVVVCVIALLLTAVALFSINSPPREQSATSSPINYEYRVAEIDFVCNFDACDVVEDTSSQIRRETSKNADLTSEQKTQFLYIFSSLFEVKVLRDGVSSMNYSCKVSSKPEKYFLNVTAYERDDQDCRVISETNALAYKDMEIDEWLVFPDHALYTMERWCINSIGAWQVVEELERKKET